LCSLNYFKNCEKLAQQIDSRAVADLAHHILLRTLMQSMLSQEGALGTHNYQSDRQGNWHFAEVRGTHHTQRHSAKVPEKTTEARSGIQHIITDQAISQ